ncbi:MAG: hypothetical protein R3F05_20935, partial [Planctomycetota bacterium]
MTRSRPRLALLVALVLLPWVGAYGLVPHAAAAEGDDGPVLRTDPAGEATRLLARAAASLDAGDVTAARHDLQACVETAPDALVALRGLEAFLPVGEDTTLAWPARRIVALAAARLGDQRDALVEPFEAAAARRMQKAGLGEGAAAADVAVRDPMTRAGDAALLVTAESDIEAGDLA